MGLYQVLTKRITRVTWSSLGRYTEDLRRLGVNKPFIGIEIKLAGQVTAGAGGAIATLVEDAPAGQLSNIKLYGYNHDRKAQDVLIDAPGRIAYWIGNFVRRSSGLLTAPTPAASSSGNFAMGFWLPFGDPYPESNVIPGYVDPREYSQLQLEIVFGNNTTDYAASNVSTMASVTLDITVHEIVNAPALNQPHFTGMWNRLEFGHESAQARDETPPVGGGGLVPLVIIHTHDDSATGNSQRPDGLVGILYAKYGGQERLFQTWGQLLEHTRGAFPLAVASSMPTGYAIWEPDPNRELRGFLDTRRAALNFAIDSATAPEQDITDVVPATSDRVDFYALTLVPSPSMAGLLASKGL